MSMVAAAIPTSTSIYDVNRHVCPSSFITSTPIRRAKKTNKKSVSDVNSRRMRRTISKFTNHMTSHGKDLKMIITPNYNHERSDKNDNNNQLPSSLETNHNLILDYFNALRPVTVLQAVGSLVVGYLALATPGHLGEAEKKWSIGELVKVFSYHKRLFIASTTVYMSYGCGMVMNDCVDVNIDSTHAIKQERAIASGRISQRAGWRYCSVLSLLSLGSGFLFVGNLFTLWTCFNLSLMLGYALGLQKIFLLKNIICGFLAISPLGGAILVNGADSVGLLKLSRLACVGFPLHVAREILKDIEDMDVDCLEGFKKLTIPLITGEKVAHRIAYGIVGMICSIMIVTPWYWNIFLPSKCAAYPLSVAIGVTMCIRASFLPVSEGQKLLKKSIFVLLAGMITSLVSNS